MLIENEQSISAPTNRPTAYWSLVILLLFILFSLYLYHLATAFIPDRVIYTIPLLNLEIYWYAICILAGIMLGAYLVTQLVQERMLSLFLAAVPLTVQQRPLTDLRLTEAITHKLSRQKISNVGHLLLKWGNGPSYLGLKQAELDTVQAALLALPDVAEDWVQNPAWRIWSPEHVWGGIGWCLALGIIGARLYHVLTPSPSMAAIGIETPLDYFRNPTQLFNLRNGGLGIYGGIVGGLLGLIIYTYRQRIPLWGWADLCAIALALGQVFGRWGNFFNQELYGRPTNLFWGVYIDPLHRLPDYSQFDRFHPAFLYESLWSLLTLVVLLRLLRHRHLLPGDLAALYLIFYGIGRSLLELVRLDSRMFVWAGVETAVPIATLVSLTLVIAMLIGLLTRHQWAKRHKRE